MKRKNLYSKVLISFLFVLTLIFAFALGNATDVSAAQYPTGKNYIDESNFPPNQEGLEVWYYSNEAIDLKPNTTYTFSFLDWVNSVDFTTNNDYFDLSMMTKDGSYYVYTFTTGEVDFVDDLSFMIDLQYYDQYMDNFNDLELQLEEGSSRTTYESFTSWETVVDDSIAPVISGGSGSYLTSVDNPISVTTIKNSFTALDDVDGSTPIVVENDNYTANNDTLGSYTLDITATDDSGNKATFTVTVHVLDNVAPVITLNGSSTVYVEYGNVYSESNATATDNYDSSVTVSKSGTVNNSTLGTYTITYTASDSSGNAAASVTRTVIVRDTTKPVITLTGSSTVYVEFGDNYSEQGATWTDAYDGSGSATVSGSVNVGTLGTYTRTYTYTDSSGNVANSVTRTVIVHDTTAPTVTGDLTYTTNLLSVTTATDIYEYLLTMSDTHTSELNVSIENDTYTGNETTKGTYTYDVRVADSTGNATVKTITVTVADNQAPVLSSTLTFYDNDYINSLTTQELIALLNSQE